MSTIIVAAILIISTVFISMLFIHINRKKAGEQNEKLLKLFSHAGSAHGLAFTSQEVLKNKIIGFDGLHQTIMVFEFENDNNVICINVAKAKTCSVKKVYDTVNTGTENSVRIEKFLRSVDLNFVFRDGNEPVSVSFYDVSVNSIFEMAELEARAKGWETVLTKMISKEVKAPLRHN